VGHDTPVSDQVSDNGTEHSGISVPGPGRLATGKIIKRRPSEVLRDEAVNAGSPRAGPRGDARALAGVAGEAAPTGDGPDKACSPYFHTGHVVKTALSTHLPSMLRAASCSSAIVSPASAPS
jgi:hypothetical protein